MKNQLTLAEVENGFVIGVDGRSYCVEGTEEDFLKWWRAYKDNKRLKEEERRKAVVEAAGPTTATAIAMQLEAQKRTLATRAAADAILGGSWNSPLSTKP